MILQCIIDDFTTKERMYCLMNPLLIVKIIINHHGTLCIVCWYLAPGARGDSSNNAGLQHGATGGAGATAQSSHRSCGAAGGSTEGM